MDILTLSEASAELGIKPSTLRSQIRFGKIEARMIGPVWVVSREEVDRYRQEHLGKSHIRSAAQVK